MKERNGRDREQGDGPDEEPRQRSKPERPRRADRWNEQQSDEQQGNRDEDGSEVTQRRPHEAAHQLVDIVAVDGVPANMDRVAAASIESSCRGGARVEHDTSSLFWLPPIVHASSVLGAQCRVQLALKEGVIMLRCLVVDDEKPARDDLAWMLEREAEVSHIEQASGGADALKALSNAEVAFDVVFLDMKMPDLSGLDIARMIDRFEESPAVVFVTAFDTPASDAFELGVVDYLRKPVAADRLNRAVRRVVSARQAPTESTESVRIAVSGGGGSQVLLSAGEVTHLRASGDYVRVHTDDDSFLIRDTMTSLTEQWSADGFVRIHRGYSVRLSAVSEIRTSSSGRRVLVGDEELPVSRRYSRALTERLHGESPQ